VAADALKQSSSAAPRDAATGPADLVVRGATIHTAAPARPRAAALAVRGGHVVAIGGDAEVAAWIGSDTTVLDLGGRTVLPGLIDSHGHMMGLGATLEQVRLTGSRSYA